jgi:hypothetical protein
MVKRNKLPVGALFIVLVLALAMVGVGYGLWADKLYIDGTVATGTVDVMFSDDPWAREEDHGKEVGNCEAQVGDMNSENDLLTIEVTNTYPSYECWVEFEVLSVGSIPVHIYQPDLGPLPPANEVTVSLDTCYPDDYQLHQGGSANCTIYIHVEQAAQQDSRYSFAATIEARQFNEPRP